MNMIPLLVSWTALALVVLSLAIYRKIAARGEDDYLHVDAKVNAEQELITKKLEVIDKWGKSLTVLAALYGLVIFCIFLYKGWTQTSTIQ